MSIVLQGSTSGSITLQEPAVAGSNTINLPAATGTAVLTGVSGTVDINAAGSNNVTLSTNSTERVRVDSSGNVGIGTSSPTSKLHVKDGAVNIENTSGYGVIEMGGSSGAFIDMKNPFSDDFDLRVQTDGSTAFLITAGSIPLTFQTNSTERMRIDSSGNVGIGTTSPAGAAGRNLTIYNSSGQSRLALKNSVTGDGANDGFQVGIDGDGIALLDQRENLEMKFSTNATERMRIASGGELGYLCTGLDGDRPNAVGSYKQTNGNTKVRVVSDGSAAFQFYSPTGGSGGPVGSIVPNASSVSYNTTSDYRLKENIAPMTGALEKVAKLKPCTYTWKVNGFAGQGFIAHELQAVVPDAVTGEKDAVETYTDEEGKEQTRPKYQGVDTSFLVATLTAAIQELKGIVDTQATKIAELEAKLEGTA